MSSNVDTTPTEQTIMSEPQSLSAGVVVDRRFRVDACLASGGYGDVWSGWDMEANRPIAVKILRTDAGNNDPSAIARMRQEAEILKAMSHPNIVEVYGFGDSAYGHYLAMELLDGLAIDQLLAREGPAETERAIPVIAQLLRALAESHSKRILHRDLKPENIIVVRDPKDPTREVAKLVDFGIAKAYQLLDESEEGATLVQTRAGGFMGTPRYAAPEQAVGDPCGPNIDLFALGLVIAEWLTGRMRIDGERHADVMTQLLSPEPIDISDVPYRWREWLTKMLQKNPRERFQTAMEAHDAMQHLVVELHRKADFLDSGSHIGGSAPAAAAAPSFISNEAPLELDYERVRQIQHTPSPFSPITGMQQGVQGPPDNFGRPAQAPAPVEAEKESAAYVIIKYLFLAAVAVATAGVIVLLLSNLLPK